MLGPRGKEWTVAVEPRTIAPGASELSVDIGDEAAIGARGRQPVGGNDGVIGGGEAGRFVGGKREQQAAWAGRNAREQARR